MTKYHFQTDIIYALSLNQRDQQNGIFAKIMDAALDKIPDSEKNTVDGHPGRTETEFVMASRPDLVHLERDNPAHQDGSAVHSKREIGRQKCELAAQFVADCIKDIKADTKAGELMAEYFSAWQ